MKVDTKISRIKILIQRLEGGRDITISSMNRVLTPVQMKEFKTDWEDELSNRRVQKPTPLKTYERMIRVGSLHYQKMEIYSFTKDKNQLAKKFSDKAEDIFEKALEYLQEQLQTDSNLRMWIDREPDGSNLTPMGVPRVIGSSSFECLVKTKTPYPVFTKRELKLRALESALSDLTEPSLESLDVTEEIVHFLKPKNFDFSSFRY
jgi:hypothetical protein